MWNLQMTVIQTQTVSRKYWVVRTVMMRTTFQTWGPGPSVDGFCKKKIINQVFHFSQEIQQYSLLFKMEQIWNMFIITLLQNSFKLLSTRQIYMHNNRSRPVTKYARSEQWKPATIYEMKKFLGLMFLKGVIWKPKLEWYWSTRSILLTPIFSQTMSRNT
jgi:hypothetical protein